MSHDPHPHKTCRWQSAIDWDALDPASVPDEPGFYAFTDYSAATLQPTQSGRNVLYVGIATRSLRSRLRKYKTGDTSGIAHMHRGGFLLLLSRAAAAHADETGRVTHSVQRKPIQVTVRPGAGQPAQQRTIEPDRIYVRWAVDPRAAIEAMLIRELNPKYNTMHQAD